MKILREPLFHFLLAGAVLYAGDAWLESGSGTPESDRIVRLTRTEVDWLRDSWQRQWRRPPTEEELRRMVHDLLQEELLSREARELGLDENDTVVRRRLAQKMTFIVEDTGSFAEPSKEDLRRIHEDARGAYGSPVRVSFRHVYLSRDRRGDRLEADARGLLGRLAGGEEAAAEEGDPFLLQDDFVLENESSLAGMFGPGFAKAVRDLDPGSWQGPVASGYGLHLVRVSHREAAGARTHAGVRERLVEEWFRERREEARRKHFDSLLEKYRVEADPGLEAFLPRRSPAGGQP